MTEKKTWEVWSADGETREDDAARIKAADAESAAVAWAVGWDAEEEYRVATGSTVDCWVAPADGSAEPVRLRVRGECSPTYWVEESEKTTHSTLGHYIACERCPNKSPFRESPAEAKRAAQETGWGVGIGLEPDLCPRCSAELHGKTREA